MLDLAGPALPRVDLQLLKVEALRCRWQDALLRLR